MTPAAYVHPSYNENPLSSNSLKITLFLSCLVQAQQQHWQIVKQQQNSNTHTKDTKYLESIETIEKQRYIDILTPSQQILLATNKNDNDASAIATLAPAENAVVAPLPRLQSSNKSGLSSPQIARSLRDWEVEDFVLLATIDGKLHALDRNTGEEKWEISHEQPMVQIKYHPRTLSDTTKSNIPTAIDDYLWILEPSNDGKLFTYRPYGPNSGIINTGLTMKKLVEEMSPYGDEDPPVMYTGEKKTNLLTVDANTGKVLSWFGSMNSLMTKETCYIGGEAKEEEDGKCPKTATITLGRTEYTVGIFGRKDGHHIATITYSEWGPNNYDQDLQIQYIQNATTLDNKYIYPQHNGDIIGINYERGPEQKKPGFLFHQKFPSPVVRVFDVARPWGSNKTAPDLVILSQPQAPFIEDEISTSSRSNSVFLNHTEDGSWYAISETFHPLISGGTRQARCNLESWLDQHPNWNILNNTQISEALVGLHSVDIHESEEVDELLTISAPDTDETREDSQNEITPEFGEDTAPLEHILQLPRIAAHSLVEFLKNPTLLILMLVSVIINQRKIRVALGNSFNNRDGIPVISNAFVKAVAGIGIFSNLSQKNLVKITAADPAVDLSKNTPKSSLATVQISELNLGLKERDGPAEQPHQAEIESPKKREKKAHRGHRGGVKHKKGARNNAREGIVASNPKLKDPLSVGQIVREAQEMSPPTRIEPDIQHMSSNPQEISGSLIRIGALEVNTDKLIGTGSNGTMVFEGRFDGREVAVKRMLIQFFDIAFQETKLLRESDDHPNVIRYFTQQQAAGFLYIALELCPASLADVIDKPHSYRELALAGEKDLPNVLYQITNGLRHLHKLRIVHRDLKPHNILVSIDKDGKPRLLVSDFGLCKKLEGEQSSFRATTAHAAGTSGWRAPELLLDDDAKDGNLALVDASTDGYSDSIELSTGTFSNRRATRAIDIFSLGLIFFYVLTKGSHPFDCGDRFMREVNIRNGKYDLRSLEVLGDYAFEAKDLIRNMLAAEPKHRPQAYRVMAHPFFWSAKKRLNFLCDVSDHFEKEKRDPPSPALQELEYYAAEVCGGDFLRLLGKDFVDSMGKQRKYTGSRLLDLLRALRNKKNHYEDLSEKLKKEIGPLPEGYLSYWSRRFPQLLVICWSVIYDLHWDEIDRFKDYYEPVGIER
ncbi:BgTH12-00364 [Blumeria graminis f. sp. triticale]|uniref:non-specific serine/threonine protein kinase n=1 Tax=Blumeria graminis f. sp. triticale TaxID=1689686 RepID=A0A9W4GGR9_BLUGR|nr:BgTH12-00364 [Blumeria graminis f. sp. triticale]